MDRMTVGIHVRSGGRKIQISRVRWLTGESIDLDDVVVDRHAHRVDSSRVRLQAL
jgi:hypothetical protein